MVDRIRLQQIDESTRADHFHLSEEDECYYLFEYTSKMGYEFSQTNQLITNLKKKPSLSHRSDYRYKGKAIRSAAASLADVLNKRWLAQTTLVPVPGSKAADHRDFDDRMTQICTNLSDPPPDVRLLVRQNVSMVASHEAQAGERVSVDELLGAYSIDETLADGVAQNIAIVDDVLTAGTHFKAMSTILSRRFPDAKIVGLFVARRVFPSPFVE